MMDLKPLIVLAALTAVLAGCHRPNTVAELDARDRESAAMRHALECEQVGDLDGAIRRYEEALLDVPRLASAHLHLALLLQDHRKDYMGAIYHYHQYELLRPDSEKKALIKERVRISEQLLVAQMMSRGDVAISREQQKLVSEIERLNQRLSQQEEEKAALLDQKTIMERQLIDLRIATNRLQRLVDRLQVPGSAEDSRERSALPRLEPLATMLPSLSAPPAPPAPPARNPAETPARGPAPPAAGNESAPTGTAGPPAPTVRTVEPAGPSETESVPPPAPAGMRTYVAQPGDSVYRIAERVYGDPNQWRRIRDANRDRLGPDNLVRAGQILMIP